MQMVARDTVYDLFKSGELPGCKVGRKWITTRAALLRWVEGSLAPDATADSVERGLQSRDKTAWANALKGNTVGARRGA
jgi:excisionase family DNA binding protein